jgi:hypothetical protein
MDQSEKKLGAIQLWKFSELPVCQICGAITVFTVPDRRSWILEVVIVRRLVIWVLGIWRGEGWERVEKGEVSLQAT